MVIRGVYYIPVAAESGGVGEVERIKKGFLYTGKVVGFGV